VTGDSELFSQSASLPPNAIAVVGMAGRFPGADSVSEFWSNLRRGEESIVTLSEENLRAAGIGDKVLANSAYVRRAALLDGIEEFDASFFGFTPQAARTMDPQHRLFLQSAWHALEDAGYDPADIEGSVGVYGTSTTSGYLLHNLMSQQDPNLIIGQGVTFEMVNLSLQNDKDYLATRVAHQFNFRGPALSVQTACSSSLVAVHLACQSILNGESDMALAGGASLRVPHHVGYWHEPGSMVSATGHCRPFDVRSDGTIFGSGVAVVVLKSLEAAVEDGDRIHAVIRGSALNNDGSAKMTFAAPNAAGQADVIAEAHAMADVDASTVSYIETHGTGTPLGDPIEIEGLRQAFSVSTTARPGPCYIGSVKSNIGHLESAAGMAGLIKAILCLKHRAIPATLHYTSPNPEMHIDRGPFVVRSEYGPWEWDGALRAGVSSFGVGGTNAHVVLEEAPVNTSVTAVAETGPQVLLLSARTAEALQRSRDSLAAELTAPEDVSLSDVAYTLGRRRQENVRMAAVVSDRQNAAAVLGAAEHDNVFVGESVQTTGSGSERVVFLFPGQGAQHVGMARGLYESEPVFAEWFDQCAAGFRDELNFDLRADIFDGTARNLERTDRTQPALFTVEYALAKLIESYGIKPAAMAGHSIGEYVAATIAGVFDLPTAIKAVSMRARLMHSAPRGVMVAVPLGPDAIAEYLSTDVDLATVNDPNSCVVAGTDENIRSFSERLAAAGIAARRVRTSHAFHSRLMDPVLPEFQGFLSRLTLRAPKIPLLSNVTGTWMSDSEATNAATWARQVRATVRFADEVDAVLADPQRVVVEVGPGGTLTASAMRHPRWSTGHRAVRLMRHHAQNREDRDAFLLSLGQLWAAGVDVDWSPLRGDQQPKLVTLPGYPFERQRHWVEHNAAARWASESASTNGVVAQHSAEASDHAESGSRPPMEATVERIWAQCLGVSSIDPTANFFELGGDSLIAISVAMAATHEGLDITPQDLYDNPTVATLAKALVAKYAAGGLARQSPSEVEHPPVPPNIEYFLENGVRDRGQWRVPFVLRLRADVQPDDIRSVLTAVINHHDALRLSIAQRAGTWEQHVGDPVDVAELTTRSLPDDASFSPGTAEEREAVLAILREQIAEQDLSSPPLSATYVRGLPDGPSYLAISVHGIVSDNASRDILLTDIFTAFAQRLAGEDIALQPVTTSWGEWSQRCAALATHSAVVESRDFWLDTQSIASRGVVGAEVSEPPAASDLVKLTSSLSVTETSELDDMRRRLRLPIEEILLAALSRTIGATAGEGSVAIDLEGPGRSILKPDVDLRRTVGRFTTVYPIALGCTNSDGGARQLLDEVHDTLNAVPHHGIGYGLLRYLYAPTARLLGSARPSDVYFSYAGTIPELPSQEPDDAAVQFDTDTSMAVREALPGLGHAVELRVYRSAGVLHLDWWYDTRRVESTLAQSLSDGFSAALMELTHQAIVEDEMEMASDDLALVDLS
jgi:phthiocerol/phenolphthiocerol synthesis type-I polyketide synthase E